MAHIAKRFPPMPANRDACGGIELLPRAPRMPLPRCAAELSPCGGIDTVPPPRTAGLKPVPPRCPRRNCLPLRRNGPPCHAAPAQRRGRFLHSPAAELSPFAAEWTLCCGGIGAGLRLNRRPPCGGMDAHTLYTCNLPLTPYKTPITQGPIEKEIVGYIICIGSYSLSKFIKKLSEINDIHVVVGR